MAGITRGASAPGGGTLKKVAQSVLGVSEPPPHMFGNPANPSKDPDWTNWNWLKSRFHFSFAEYHNPHNQNFGVLRVMNDDLVQPQRGFATHGHRDAEICTYVVEGELSHKDSMGTSETLGPGAVQFMTAGSGVQHSEHNQSPKPLRFIQMWLTPRARGLTPNYGSTPGSKESRFNAWHHMVSDTESDAVTDVKINVDANMYVAEIDEGQQLAFNVEEGRQAYVLCVDGTAKLTRQPGDDREVWSDPAFELQRHDASEIVGPVQVSVSGPSHMLVVEMRYDARSAGRRDLP